MYIKKENGYSVMKSATDLMVLLEEEGQDECGILHFMNTTLTELGATDLEKEEIYNFYNDFIRDGGSDEVLVDGEITLAMLEDTLEIFRGNEI